jgi:4'-phosphopantetheinyl transferase
VDALASLGPGHVHVWRADLDLGSEELRLLAAVLAADERERAERFLRPADRSRFVAGRGLLRLVLATYLGWPAGALQFSSGPAGKPALRGTDRLRFNLSHSAGRGLVAVASGREVGVDLERIDEGLSWPELCRFLPEREQRRVRTSHPADRRRAFFESWTRHEALLKAQGLGMGLAGAAKADTTGWSTHPLEEPGFAASLVLEGGPAIISRFSARLGGEQGVPRLLARVAMREVPAQQALADRSRLLHDQR